MSVHYLHAWCCKKPEKGIRSLGMVIIGGCMFPSGVKELNACPVQAWLVLLTAKTSPLLQCGCLDRSVVVGFTDDRTIDYFPLLAACIASCNTTKDTSQGGGFQLNSSSIFPSPVPKVCVVSFTIGACL